LKAFVLKTKSVSSTTYDYAALYDTIREMTRNLNRVIDVNYYPLEAARRSNMRHRPIGLGVQGLQDTLFEMRFPYDSEEAATLNRAIFKTIYYAACTASCELAKLDGCYETFHGSPASKGLLQPDLWAAEPLVSVETIGNLTLDWVTLKDDIRKHGMRNSLLVAPMPTASTAQILGNTECFEPISSNVYSRSTLAGTFVVVNKYLVNDLRHLGLWNNTLKNRIVGARGSIQEIAEIPAEIRALYKTVWELSQRVILDMAIARAPYIDQSQSLNIHMALPTYKKLTSLHFYAWRGGLKTGMYYLRTKAKADAAQVTVNPTTGGANSLMEAPLKASFGAHMTYKAPDDAVCNRDDPGCDSCGA
jgi:ribonucleoside-diphosphate reductase alpha chain